MITGLPNALIMYSTSWHYSPYSHKVLHRLWQISIRLVFGRPIGQLEFPLKNVLPRVNFT